MQENMLHFWPDVTDIYFSIVFAPFADDHWSKYILNNYLTVSCQSNCVE